MSLLAVELLDEVQKVIDTHCPPGGASTPGVPVSDAEKEDVEQMLHVLSQATHKLRLYQEARLIATARRLAEAVSQADR